MRVGDRVLVKSSGESGRLEYVGELRGKAGTFFGVRLDRAAGKNDGCVDGRRYFTCEARHGTFVRADNLSPARGTGTKDPRPARGAARSHELNEAYLEDFEKGYAALAASAGCAPGRTDAEELESKNASVAAGALFDARSFAAAHSGWKGRADSSSWGKGPRNPEGQLFDASDQPLLCAALSPDARECVVGGCDHGLRVFDVATGKEKRNLFTNKFGHREWVTGCSYLPDGSILSAGMDNKLCLWRGVRCDDMEGHRGSISKSIVAEGGRYALSASYDKTVRVWDLRSSREAGCMTGHKAPILEMALNEGKLLTGSRDGVALAWDLATGSPHRLDAGQHKGHVTSLHTFGSAQFSSGDQAGFVRVWDLRVRGARAATGCLHAGGAVNEIRATEDGKLVTAGADKRILVVDPRRMDDPLLELAHHKDFIYSLEVTSDHVLSGAGDGLMLVHELSSGRLCYGLGANAAGVRCIVPGPGFVVAAGDDGNALTYRF